MLHFRTRDELAVDFHFTTIVIARGHAVPTERNDRVILHDHTSHFEALGVAALRRQKGDLHVHLIVFADIHDSPYPYSSKRLKIKVPFVPPKPKLFFMA